jgi:hypothetical protein
MICFVDERVWVLPYPAPRVCSNIINACFQTREARFPTMDRRSPCWSDESFRSRPSTAAGISIFDGLISTNTGHEYFQAYRSHEILSFSEPEPRMINREPIKHGGLLHLRRPLRRHHHEQRH